ncbi:MAG: hypothetical protein J2P58_05830 [Acidimicrobiaceae bacterium]|nr:hypothetical protein [Acidimicrobiaceae bacterium]
MPVLDSAALNELICASEDARAAAAEAIARSVALRPVVDEVQRRSLVARIASRPNQTYVRLQGMVEGLEVVAVVRTDGSVVGTPGLLRRAGLVVAMGERFDDDQIEARIGGDPVAAALTLIRACDWVFLLDLVGLDSPRPSANASLDRG